MNIVLFISIRSEDVNQIDGRLGRSHVVVRLVRFHFFAASGAPEPVVAGVGIAEADFGFEVPVAVENPCVAVCHARTDEPTLVAVVLEFAGIGSEQVDHAVETAHVVQACVHVRSEKMAGKAVAEPIARFGLQDPVLPPAVVRKRPAVELPRGVERPSGCQTHLGSEIDVEECVGEQVGLDCRFLCLELLGHASHDDRQQ